ncbi:nuclear transport factor 2 family protein [Serratia ureilytica]
MNDKTARPQDVVQQQLDAYNARDIEAFMACWADDAQYYEHPDTLLASGKAAIRERHLARFREPSLYGERIKRMAVGNMVVDQEVVTRNFPQGAAKWMSSPFTKWNRGGSPKPGSRSAPACRTKARSSRNAAHLSLSGIFYPASGRSVQELPSMFRIYLWPI